MPLLVLVSILILPSLNLLPGLNLIAQRQQSNPSPVVVSQSPDASQQKHGARSAIAAKLSMVCGSWAKYWRQKELDKVLALYASDAVFLTATGDRIRGRQAIGTLFKAAMEGHTSDLTPRSLTTEVSGNLAYDSGDYLESITSATGVARKELKGNYVIVFKRQRNGRWLIIQHVWTDKPENN